MRHVALRVIIGIVLCIAMRETSQAAFTAGQVKPLILKYKKLMAQKEEAENESGLQSIEKINRLEEEINKVSTQIKAMAPDWSDSNQTDIEFLEPASTMKTRLSTQENRSVLKKLTSQDYKSFLEKEMTDLRLKMLDYQDKISKTTEPQKHILLQQELRRMSQEMNLLRNSLEETGKQGKAGYKTIETPYTSIDLKNKDRDHERFLQDQLQEIYKKIYLLREKSLKEQSGAALRNLGNEITELENEELSLTRRLLAMGVKPLPPKVLGRNKGKIFLKESKSSESERYYEDLKNRIQDVTEEIQFLQEMKKKATSGAAMAELGLQIAKRESEIGLLKESLRQVSPLQEETPRKTFVPAPKKQVQGQQRERISPEVPIPPLPQHLDDASFLLQSPALTSSSKPLWGRDYQPEEPPIVPQEVRLTDQQIQENQAAYVSTLIDQAAASNRPAPQGRSLWSPTSQPVPPASSNWGRMTS